MYTTNNRCPGKTWEEKEKYIISNTKPLIIKDFSLTEYDDTLEDFIHNYLFLYNNKYITVPIYNMDQIQCTVGKLRSLIDIYSICRHYFTGCTLREVKDALYSNRSILSSQVCNTINRRVYWIKLPHAVIRHEDQKDELGFTINELINKD